MKISLLAYGSRGDVQPYVALALALKARGHQPLLAASENFRSFVQGFGLDYAPLAGDTRAMMESGDTSRLILAGSNRAFFLEVSRQMEPLKERFWDSLLAASHGADLVLNSPVTEFIGASAAEAAGVRSALSFLAPMLPSSEFASPAFPVSSFRLPFLDRMSHGLASWGWWSIHRQGVNQARKHWGLAPLSASPTSVYLKKGGLALMGFSPSLFPRPSDWSAGSVVTGAWELPAGSRSADPQDADDPGFLAWLEDGAPPVFFGFGSMPVPDHEGFLEMAAELCEELGLRALIGPGWNDLDMAACDLPDNLAVVERVDHAWLFPQCAAVVHHGGAGTTQAALRAGIPSVVCPFFADQPFWAKRVAALGAGSRLPFKKMDYPRLKRALLDALGEKTQARAAALGAAMRQEQGCDRAVEALEAWMGRSA